MGLVKICGMCGEEKSHADFYKDRGRRDGLQYRCKSCSRSGGAEYRKAHPGRVAEWNRTKQERHGERLREVARYRYAKDPDALRGRAYRRKYGISIDDYNQMFAEQDGRCLICNRTWHTHLHVDHCHDTGLVRGLLCGRCNLGLGQFNHEIECLTAAAEYLRRASHSPLSLDAAESHS